MTRFDSVFRPGLFQDRVILVTGGGSGIGRCTAHELAALGAQVVIAGRQEEKLALTAEEIRKAGGRCDHFVADIRDEEAVETGVAGAVERHGRIDGLFNNAGGQFAAPLESMSASAWRKVVDTNLHGTFNVTMAVFRRSLREHGGAVVNMLADIDGGFPWMAHSAAARAGIENLTRTLSLEWAQYQIRLNAVAPGTIVSSGMLTYPQEVQEISARAGERIPMARLGTESEISAAVTFLLSPAASYVTGTTLRVDGGQAFEHPRLMNPADHAPSPAWNGFHLRPKLAGTPFEDLDQE